MISGLNATGHEIGGTIVAIFSTIAAGTGVLAGPQAAPTRSLQLRSSRASPACSR